MTAARLTIEPMDRQMLDRIEVYAFAQLQEHPERREHCRAICEEVADLRKLLGRESGAALPPHPAP